MPVLVQLFQNQIERALGANQHRGESEIEAQALGLQPAAGRAGFRNAFFGQAYVTPAGEEVFFVPLALTMPHQYQHTLTHSLCSCIASVQISFTPSTSAIE